MQQGNGNGSEDLIGLERLRPMARFRDTTSTAQPIRSHIWPILRRVCQRRPAQPHAPLPYPVIHGCTG